MTELKAVVVNLKSLDQDIPDPIIVGGGDADSRYLKIIFTQEAQAQLTSETKVYLKWHHQELDIQGYNVFTKVTDDTGRFNIWQIKWPKEMHHVGNVTCCIELVDSVSIAQTVSFIVSVLEDPHSGTHFVWSDDFTDFQNACIALATLEEEVDEQFEEWQQQFAEWEEQFEEWEEQILPTEITDVQNGQILKYNSTKEKWINTEESGGGGGIPTEITDPQDGQILLYNGTKTKWINKNLVDEQSIIYLDEETAGLAIKGYKAAPQGYMLVKDNTQGIAWVKPVDTSTLEQYVQQAQTSATQAGTYAVQAGNSAIEALEAEAGAEAAQTAVENKMWYGSMEQYNALTTINPTTFYFILDGEITNG